MITVKTGPQAGRYFVTEAYIAGAAAVQSAPGTQHPNPYPPGPAHAQFVYGMRNERAGVHDDLDELVRDL